MNNNQTTAQIIFNRLYLCQIQRKYMINRSDTDVFGVSTTGNREMDMALMNEWVHCKITIAAMVEHYSKGVNIIIVNEVDAVAIYKVITEHLKAFQQYVKDAINPINIPVEDLEKMDAFATKLFPIAKRGMKPEEMNISKSFKDFLDGKRTALAKPKPVFEESLPEEFKHEPRANVISADFFSRHGAKR